LQRSAGPDSSFLSRELRHFGCDAEKAESPRHDSAGSSPGVSAQRDLSQHPADL